MSTVRTKKLIKMFDKVKKQILAEPKLYNQDSFGDVEENVMDKHGFLVYKDNCVLKTNACNTPACIAGWIAFNVLGKKEYKKRFANESLDSHSVALKFLQENNALDMADLFEPSNDWPIELSLEYEEATTSRKTAKVGVKAINYFLEGKHNAISNAEV